jgi:hypothetical protein
MLFCFIDESTTPPKPGQRGRPPYFVIGAVFLPLTQWHGIARELQVLKEQPQYKIRGEIKWRYFGAANDDPKNTVAHLNMECRDSFRESFYEILTRRNSVKTVASVVNVERAYEQTYINNEHDIYGYAYKPISERFQYHLQDISRATGDTNLGIVVADHRGREDDGRLKKEHQKLVHSQSYNTSHYNNIVEGLFLTQSHMSIGIQFADM